MAAGGKKDMNQRLMVVWEAHTIYLFMVLVFHNYKPKTHALKEVYAYFLSNTHT